MKRLKRMEVSEIRDQAHKLVFGADRYSYLTQE